MSYPETTGLGLGLALRETGLSMGNTVARAIRYFRINEGSTDYATIPPITLSADFVIEFVSLGVAATFGRILGNTASFDNEVRLNSDDASLSMKFSAGVSRQITFDAGITRGNLNKFKISRVSGVVSLTLNGVIQASTFVDAGALNLDAVHKSSTSINTGVVSNLIFTDAGTLTRSYPINEASGTAIFDEVSGQDGTIVLGSDDDRGVFQEITLEGNWQGSALVVPPWDSVNQILIVS